MYKINELKLTECIRELIRLKINKLELAAQEEDPAAFEGARRDANFIVGDGKGILSEDELKQYSGEILRYTEQYEEKLGVRIEAHEREHGAML